MVGICGRMGVGSGSGQGGETDGRDGGGLEKRRRGRNKTQVHTNDASYTIALAALKIK